MNGFVAKGTCAYDRKSQFNTGQIFAHVMPERKSAITCLKCLVSANLRKMQVF